MPTEVRGGVEARKALRKYAPDLAKAIQKEMGELLKPVTNKARGFIPSTVLSGWSKPLSSDVKYKPFPKYDATEARRKIGYKTTPSKANSKGFTSLARIENKSAAGAIYEIAGRSTASANQKNMSANPNARQQFIDALNGTGKLVDANNQTGAAKIGRNLKGRALYRAWAEDGGKTNAAVLKALEVTKQIFDRSMKAVK